MGNKKLFPSFKYQIRTRDTHHSLIVKDIDESDIGEYSIEASNTKGHTKAQFSLKVSLSSFLCFFLKLYVFC